MQKRFGLMTVVYLLASLAVSGCGKTRHISAPPKDDQDPNQRTSCPLALVLPSHRALIKSADGIPAKVAVKVDGVPRLDECLEPAASASAPRVERRAGSADELEIAVIHLDAYPTLPTQFTIEIADRGDCKSVPTPWFSASNVALEFKTDSPYGENCAKRTLATVNLTR